MSHATVLLLEAGSRPELSARVTRALGILSSASPAEPPAPALFVQGVAREPHRLAIVASSTADAITRLTVAKDALDNTARSRLHDPSGVYYFGEPLGPAGKVAFLFPGDGAPYPGMFASLRTLLATSRWLQLIERGLGTALPMSEAAPDPSPEAQGRINLAVSLAFFDLLARLGLSPDMVVGHSYGEWAALLAVGNTVFDGEDELLLAMGRLTAVWRAGETEQQRLRAASVVVVASDPTLIGRVVARHPGRLFLAADNCVHQAMLGGFEDAVEEAILELSKHGAICTRVAEPQATHTPLFEGMAGPLAEAAAALRFGAPTAVVYSSATASRFPRDAREASRVIARQWIEPIRFRETLDAMYADGARIFVDVGPRGILAGFVEDTFLGRPHVAAAMNVATRPALDQLCHALALLVAHHLPLDLRALDHASEARPPVVPGRRPQPSAPLPFIRQIQLHDPDAGVLEASCELDLKEDLFLRDHAFGGRVSLFDEALTPLAVVPFAVSLEMLAEAATALAPDRVVVGMRDVRAHHWLALDDDGRLALRLVARESERGVVKVELRPAGESRREPFVEGTVLLGTRRPPAPRPSLPERQAESPWRSTTGDYDGPHKWMFHGPEFRTVRRLRSFGSDGVETVLVAPPPGGFFRARPLPSFVLDPVLLEGLGQSSAHYLRPRIQRGAKMPIALRELDLYDCAAPTGTEVRCVVTPRALDEPLALCDATLVSADGALLGAVTTWTDWCFPMPPVFRTFFLSPLEAFLSTPCEAGGRALNPFEPGFLESMDGFWLRVVRALVLTAEERKAWSSWGGSDAERSSRLMERIVVKDAVRSLLRLRTGSPWGAADIELGPGPVIPGRVRTTWGTVNVSLTRDGDTLSAVAREETPSDA